MNNTKELTVNRPLASTYRWLRANGTRTAVPAVCGALKASWPLLPAGIREGAEAIDHLRTGMGQEMDRLFADIMVGGTGCGAGNSGGEREPLGTSLGFTAAPGAAGTVRLDLRRTPCSGASAGVLSLRAERGSRLTAVVDVSAQDEAPGCALLQARCSLAEDAVLRLVLIQRLGAGETFYSDVGARCAENARFEYVRLVLGGGHTFDGCSAALEGDRSFFSADIGYRLGGKETLDMNYEAVHTGRRTECAIRASGVLREEARKLFRGTIDLRKGCAGSVGNETEDVLLMDETVQNVTVPVILCGEEDVVGNHGATIGRLDEQLIYYLESRGMRREDIYELCARARIDAVVRRIADPETIRRRFPWLAEEAEA